MKTTRAMTLLALVSMIAAMTACGTKPQQAAPAAAPASYEVRGEVVRLPPAGGRDLVVKHEAIPGFVDEAGKVVGMDAMTMPFTLAEGVSIEGIAPGDVVNFTLEVDWSSNSDPVRIVRLAENALIERIDLESGEAPPVQSGETPK
jgi:Cu/Ag efflux protein CusF